MRLLPLLILLSLIDLVGAQKFHLWTEAELLYLGCNLYLAGKGLCQDAADQKACFCTSKPALALMVGCLDSASASADGRLHAVHFFCSDLLEINQGTVDESLSLYRQLVHEYPLWPFSTDPAELAPYTTATLKLYANKNKSMRFGSYMVLYWCGVAVFCGAFNWPRVLLARLNRSSNIGSYLHRVVATPALFGKCHTAASIKTLPLGFIPSRAQSLALGVSSVLMVLFSCLSVPEAEQDPMHATKSIALVHYVANRIGIMTTTMFPLLVVLAGRNNILGSVARWDHATVLVLHRWLARQVLVGIVLHSVLAGMVDGRFMNVYGLKRNPYLVWGIIGTAVLVVLLIQSALVFRRRAYEVFKAVHVVLIAALYAGLWLHLAKLGYLFLVAVAIAAQVLDHVIRWAKIALFGVARAQITQFPDKSLRIEVPVPARLDTGLLKWESGHAWVRFWPWVWQAHPFLFYRSPTKPKTIVFLCKVHQGLTRKLWDRLEGGLDGAANMLLDGPYGHRAPISGHDSIVFLAAGHGFGGVFGEACCAAADPDLANVQFIFITQSFVSLTPMWEDLKALAALCPVSVYLTRELGFGNLEKAGSLKNEAESWAQYLSGDTDCAEVGRETLTNTVRQEVQEAALGTAGFSVHFGRPDIPCLLQNKASSGSRVGLVTCTSPAMADAVRRWVMEPANTSVTLYDKLQTWA